MNSSYSLLFPSRNLNLYRWMGRFVMLASTTLLLGFAGMDGWKIGWPVVGCGLLLTDLLLRQKKTGISLLTTGLLTQAVAWALYGPWWMAITLVLICALHEMSIRAPLVRIRQTDIEFSFPWPRRIRWNAIEFILLKDGLLTIEYKNGRVFQQWIEKDTSLIEADFNEFCQQQCNP